jgi:alginate O-acetyltransferase complex protein AlgI
MAATSVGSGVRVVPRSSVPAPGLVVPDSVPTAARYRNRMLFPTTDFALFFVVVFTLSWLLNPYRGAWKAFMLLASYVFYAWWDVSLVWLLALVSAIAYAGGIWIEAARTPRVRTRRTVVTVIALLLPLGWFKYYGFFALSLANGFDRIGIGAPLPLLQIVLPVGISFYTFMAISYVVDISRLEIQPAKAIDVFVYLSFFPHLVAGPIVRGDELLPQIRRRRDASHIDVAHAAWLIFGGLFKKIVISSFLAANIVDPVFGAPGAHSALEVLFAIYGYAIVIYTDFSAYTDIAIGVAELLGFAFPKNFERPYAAMSLQDFWRRWHITLSRWLRDYLYVPLGGSRKGELRTAVNIMVTMLLGGLWHGAGWTFLIWGGLHGVGQVLGRRRRRRRDEREHPTVLSNGQILVARVATFHLVCLGWVFFRAESVGAAISILGRLFTGWGEPTTLVTPLVVGTIVGMLALQNVPTTIAPRVMSTFSRLAPALQGATLALVLFVTTALGPQGVAPFIYFRF